jgi:sigma-E factor negative regulatory protein RseA
MTNFEHTHLTQQEQWSALHDGQLSSADAMALVRASLADDQFIQQWHSMSAIGQVMREEGIQLAGAAKKTASVVQAASAMQAVPIPPQIRQTASNDSRWKMVAGVAALAAVGSLVWGLLGSSGGTLSQTGAVLASNQQSESRPNAALAGVSAGTSVAQISGQEAMMIRNPRLDEFLAAHKQFGGVSALQQPAGSLRSASLATSRP